MDLLQGYSSSDDNESENDNKKEEIIVFPKKIVDIAPPVDFFGLLPTDIQSESDDNPVTDEPTVSESESVADEPVSTISLISKSPEILDDVKSNEKVEETEELPDKESPVDSTTNESSSSPSKNEEIQKPSESEPMKVDDISKEVTVVPSNEIIDLDSDDIESECPTPEKEIEKMDETPEETPIDSKTVEEEKPETTLPVQAENIATIELTDSDNENDVDMTAPSAEVPSISIPTSTETPAETMETITEPTEPVEPISKELSTEDSKTYTNKDCINYECTRKCKTFFICPIFILNFYTIPKKTKKLQYVCEECYEQAVGSFEELCGSLEDHQPLLWQKLPNRVEHVDICDSDEEELESDKRYMTAEELKLLSEKFEDSLAETLARVNITQQMKWTEQIIRKKINANDGKQKKKQFNLFLINKFVFIS